MTGSITSNFTTQNSQWSAPELFSQSGSANTAIDKHGNAITVLWRYNSTVGTYEMVVKQLNNGIWSVPKIISGSVYDPRVAMDNNGNAIMVWRDYGDWSSTGGIAMSEYRNGVWSTPRFINSIVYLPFSPASVAMNDNGKAIIVWAQGDIFKVEYDNGQWSNPVAVSSGAYSEYATVQINSSDTTLISWQYHDLTSSKLFSTVSQIGTSATPQIITSTGTDPYMQYQSALDDKGNAIVVWVQTENGTYRVYRNEYRNNSWTGPVPVSPLGVYVLYPKISMDGNGNAIMVWQQSVNNVWQVFYSEMRDGLWSISVQVSDPGFESAWPLVKMDKSGNAILLWNQKHDYGWQMLRHQFINGIWSEKYLSSVSYDHLNYITYDVAMDGSGDAEVVWSQSDGTNWQIYRSRYH